MAAMLRLLVAFCVLLSLSVSSSYAQTCGNYQFTNNKVFTSCSDLPYLNAFLHWTFDQSTGKFQMAYRHTGVTTSTWVAWAINPDLSATSAMLGAQTLVAFQNSSGATRFYTSPIGQSTGTALAEGTLTYPVSELSAEYLNNDEMIIFATWALPTNSTNILQVWQEGSVSSDQPQQHGSAPANLNAKSTLNLLSGQTASAGVSSVVKRKNIHGVLNVVSWGILLPLGAMVARYLKTFKSADPAWFYLHAACQTSAYAIGVAGWATGLKLGSESAGIQYDTHRNIGITLFCLGTLQVFALLLRPNKDHKYRFYWNIYHHTTGYAVIILSIVNIFEGFDILKPNKNWKNAYIGVIIALAVQAALLEAYTWYVVLKKKRSEKATHAHATNGANGYGA